MKPQWDSQIHQFTESIVTWRRISVTLPTTFPGPNGATIQISELSALFESVLGLLISTNSRSDINGALLAIHQPGILNPIPQLQNLVNNAQSNQSILEQICNQVWAIYASLIWVIPGRNADTDLLSKVAAMDLNGKLEALKTLSEEYASSVSAISEGSASVAESAKIASAELESLRLSEREAANAKATAEAAAASATGQKQIISEQLAEITVGVKRHQELLLSIDDLAKKATAALESSSKVALAASFSDRRKKLSTAQWVWAVAFAGGIFSLFALAVVLVKGGLSIPPLFQDGHAEIGPIVARMVLVGPLIWFTWFSARQYSQTQKLIEDYAFKEASALAFVGYQREMSEDPEMIKLLRESAIKNFGSDPARIFSKADPGSPLHELLDKAIDKGAVDKFVDLIKALKPGGGA